MKKLISILILSTVALTTNAVTNSSGRARAVAEVMASASVKSNQNKDENGQNGSWSIYGAGPDRMITILSNDGRTETLKTDIDGTVNFKNRGKGVEIIF